MMKWNIILLIVSLAALVVVTGTTTVLPLTQAESIADQLASRIDFDKEVLRKQLEQILERGQMRQTIFYAAPWIFIMILLAIRLVMDKPKAGEKWRGRNRD
jgi:hypothetical protein